MVALLCVVLTLPLNSGMTCVYTAATRNVTLEQQIDAGRLRAALRVTPGVEDVSSDVISRRFMFVPLQSDVYHSFRWPDHLHGRVTHTQGGRALNLRAYTVNQRPDEQARSGARQLLQQLERRLLEVDPTITPHGETR